ncbi:WD repeat-containing protein [Reticulomyxa filosa]|nr:WD repeat-containing protein [Reticulomyxa filosa]|eukprot:ETN98174.1 WD repeat-containing protein [Reticulomyxa filosa]
MIVSSSLDKTIGLWEVESGKILKQFKGHSDHIMRATFSPDGRFIISCSSDKTIRIWNIETGKEWKILREHSYSVNEVKYFSDGQTIVCSIGYKIQLLDVELTKKIQTLEGYDYSMVCADVSQNSNTITAGSEEGKIQIWGL